MKYTKHLRWVIPCIMLVLIFMGYATDLGLVNGRVLLPETTVPTAIADKGQLWVEADNSFHVQTGDGVDHEIPLTAAATTLDTYDAVVAVSGGDYTSVVTACATEAAGAAIFIASGTFSESASVVMKDAQSLVGQNPDDTIIDFGGGAFKIEPDGAGSNRAVVNLTVQGSIADFTVEMNGSIDRIENCRIIGTASAFSGISMTGFYSIVSDCYFAGFTRSGEYGIVFGGQYQIAADNTFATGAGGIEMNDFGIAVANNMLVTVTQIKTGGTGITLTGNIFRGTGEVEILGSHVLVTNNYFEEDLDFSAAASYSTFTGNTFVGGDFVADISTSEYITISGNTFNGGAGVEFAGQRSTISGNTFQGAASLELTATANQITATGNNLEGSTDAGGSKIIDSGEVGNMLFGNTGVPISDEKYTVEMRNLSGVTLVSGDVVIYDNDTSGDACAVTTTRGDPLILGVWNDVSTGNGSWGAVQMRGKVTDLRVDGTIDIAVGDLLTTFTTAEVAQKASGGDMAFAIALEAYATDDSAGILDALLISPRKLYNAPDYANIFVDDNATVTTINVVDAFEHIAVFDTDGPEAISDGDNTIDAITIGGSGDYEVRMTMSFTSADNNKVYELFGFEVAVSGDTISGATQANPCVVTATGHSFSNGDRVKITGVVGMTELNSRIFTVAGAGANDFQLNDDNAGTIDSTGFTAYGSAGTAFLATKLMQINAHRKIATGADLGDWSACGIVSLTANNLVELWIKCDTDATNMTVETCSFSVIRVD